MKLLSVGRDVRRGSYRLHSRFSRALNFQDGERLVSVVDETVGGGPLNVVLSGGFPDAADTLQVGGRTVTIGSVELERAGDYSACVRAGRDDAERLETNLAPMEERLIERAPSKSLAFLLDGMRASGFRPGFETALAERVREGVRLLFTGEIDGGAKALAGLGLGLTPSGDDLLAGVLYGLDLRAKLSCRTLSRTRRHILRNAQGENPFSAAFLRMAYEGLYFERLKCLAEALLRGTADEVRAAVDGLLEIGSSSGADLCTGLLMALRGWETLCP